MTMMEELFVSRVTLILSPYAQLLFAKVNALMVFVMVQTGVHVKLDGKS